MYTLNDGKCNGWNGVSLDQCKDKCWKNELPTGCTPSKPHPQCHFVVWLNSSICHLASACTVKDTRANAVVIELKSTEVELP